MKNFETVTANFAAANTHELFDLSMLEEMDDTAYLVEVLTILMEEVPRDLIKMQQALSSGNIDIICKQAHKIKSSSNVIQAEIFTALLEDIEALGKNAAPVNEFAGLVESAKQQYILIEKRLKKYINELK